MMLTTKGRYAIMAMVDLAHNSQNSPITIAEISQRQEIAISYLEQIFNRLRKFGLVESVRGPKGGYVLALDPSQIQLSQILAAAEETLKMVRCNKDGQGCMQDKSRCSTHRLWDSFGEHINQFFIERSLADITKTKLPHANEPAHA